MILILLFTCTNYSQDWVYLGEYDAEESEPSSVWYDIATIEVVMDAVVVEFYVGYNDVLVQRKMEFRVN